MLERIHMGQVVLAVLPVTLVMRHFQPDKISSVTMALHLVPCSMSLKVLQDRRNPCWPCGLSSTRVWNRSSQNTFSFPSDHLCFSIVVFLKLSPSRIARIKSHRVAGGDRWKLTASSGRVRRLHLGLAPWRPVVKEQQAKIWDGRFIKTQDHAVCSSFDLGVSVQYILYITNTRNYNWNTTEALTITIMLSSRLASSQVSSSHRHLRFAVCG